MELRDKTQADFDLERMFEMLDTAMTSKDERVQSAFRALLTIIALTKTQEDDKYAVETNYGPLRQMQQDLRDISRRLNNLQQEVRQMQQQPVRPWPNDPANPWNPPVTYGSSLAEHASLQPLPGTTA